MEDYALCVKRFSELYAFLQEKLEGNTQVTLCERQTGARSFKIAIPTKKAVHESWRYQDEEKEEIEFDTLSVAPKLENPDAFEIALFHGYELKYISSLGYYSIFPYFYKMEEVLAEILRLVNL